MRRTESDVRRDFYDAASRITNTFRVDFYDRISRVLRRQCGRRRKSLRQEIGRGVRRQSDRQQSKATTTAWPSDTVLGNTYAQRAHGRAVMVTLTTAWPT